MRNVYQYVARVARRGNTWGKPPCRDPLTENGETAFRPEEKAEMLGGVFANKMAAAQDGRENPVGTLRQQVGRHTPEGHLCLAPTINARGICFAVRAIPRNCAPGPDPLPAEMHINCPSMHKGLAALFTSLVEYNWAPKSSRTSSLPR